jgi:hypothetical protein
MIFPILPLFALLAILTGGATLGWYSRLTDEEKDLVNELAFELFDKTIEQLGRYERKLLKRKFFG